MVFHLGFLYQLPQGADPRVHDGHVPVVPWPILLVNDARASQQVPNVPARELMPFVCEERLGRHGGKLQHVRQRLRVRSTVVVMHGLRVDLPTEGVDAV